MAELEAHEGARGVARHASVPLALQLGRGASQVGLEQPGQIERVVADHHVDPVDDCFAGPLDRGPKLRQVPGGGDRETLEVQEQDLPQGYFLAARDRITLRDLAAQPLILEQRLPRPRCADLVMRHFHDRGFTPVVAFEVRDLQTALGLVGANAGIFLIPAAARSIARDDVVFRDIAQVGLGRVQTRLSSSVSASRFRLAWRCGKSTHGRH